MLSGKAYYRAMRGHQLTYAALWIIKWAMFESWLLKHGRQDCVGVKESAEHMAVYKYWQPQRRVV